MSSVDLHCYMIKYLKPTTLKNKTVLLRVDVNVPIDEKTGIVADDFRIASILPTIHMLQAGGNRIILCGHLGRPEGTWNEQFTLLPVAKKLADELKYKYIATEHELPDYPVKHLIFFTGNLLEDKHLESLRQVPQKDIVLLENIRFYHQEEDNSPILAKRLASFVDAYVDDAFSVSHHKAVSISAITKYLPSYAGPLLEREISSLERIITKPSSPFVVLMGGIKISDKIGTLENVGKKADSVLLGGGLANLFFAAKGMEVGKSKIEAEAVKVAWQLEKNFREKIHLPQDVVVAEDSVDKSSIRVCVPYEVRKNETILDIGPKTILAYASIIKNAKTVVWNGPLGHFEVKPFDTGTISLARIIGSVGKRKAFAVVGGGETVDAVRQCHQFEHIDHVSTGGGAMLEFLAGKKLPGVEALK